MTCHSLFGMSLTNEDNIWNYTNRRLVNYDDDDDENDWDENDWDDDNNV